MLIHQDNFRDYLDEEEVEDLGICPEDLDGGYPILIHFFLEYIREGLKLKNNFITCKEIKCNVECKTCIFNKHIYLTRKGADIYERFNNQ